jgi:MarR family transcriptional regulator, organic hydroperoxide resistance regulator
MLETPMTMKELGLRMGCDPSFVTSVADALEKLGLARREPSLRDRRSKNLVLTTEGVTLRDRLCGEMAARAPWCTTLDTSERRCLLGLMRKMLGSRGGR